jgi:hypothetical protein
MAVLLTREDRAVIENFCDVLNISSILDSRDVRKYNLIEQVDTYKTSKSSDKNSLDKPNNFEDT